MKLILGMQPCFNPTRRIMEDDLNILEKTMTSIFWEKEDDLKKCNQKQLQVKTMVVAPFRVT